MRALEATFCRVTDATDRIKACRSSGTSSLWEAPTYGGSLPHDLVHWIVECGFELGLGFWGLVDAGVDPAIANLRVPGKGFGQDRVELLMAEGLSSIDWFDPQADPLSRCESAREACAELGVAVPAAMTLGRVELVGRVMTDVRTVFRRTRARDLGLYPDEPRRAFFELLERIDRGALAP